MGTATEMGERHTDECKHQPWHDRDEEVHGAVPDGCHPTREQHSVDATTGEPTHEKRTDEHTDATTGKQQTGGGVGPAELGGGQHSQQSHHSGAEAEPHM